MKKITESLKIQFYIPSEDQVQAILGSDPDVDWQLFNTGVQVWVGQTFLRLQQRGMPVELTSNPPKAGIVVTHADYVPSLLSRQPIFLSLVIVAARADRPRQPYADFEIVQNAHSSDGIRSLHVPHWPQPGLVPRDSNRGDIIRTIAYKGMLGEMSDGLHSDEWRTFLNDLGLVWQCDATIWQGNGKIVYQEVKWNDYSQVDLVVAIRRDVSSLYPRKPASKLINAWAAGVPAILGPEHAYRELRRSDLDYIEASDANEAAAAICTLLKDPKLYRAMVENGLQRAKDFTARECTARWEKVLFSEIVPRSSALMPRLRRTLITGLKYRAINILKRKKAALHK